MGGDAIENVARSVGFSDVKYFSRVFKRYKGCTAGEYRKRKPEESPFLRLKEKGADFR